MMEFLEILKLANAQGDNATLEELQASHNELVRLVVEQFHKDYIITMALVVIIVGMGFWVGYQEKKLKNLEKKLDK